MKCKTGTALISSLSHEGRGIAHINGKTTFIDNGLPGEEVEFEYTRTKSRYDEGRVVRLLKPSAARQEPICQAFGVCGGCSLQHMKSETQLEHKLAVLLEQLKHIGGLSFFEILPPMIASSSNYRRKARLGIRYVFKKEKLLIGFRERNGRYLADIENCPILAHSVGFQLEKL